MHAQFLRFTVWHKVESRLNYVNFAALDLLYFMQGFFIVNGLFSFYSRKGSTEREGVENKKDLQGYLRDKQFCLAECFDVQNSICYRL